jgi:CheY-like chemotaxis protein
VRVKPVLYIEDEENDVLFMRRAFSKNRIANPLHIARDGEEALEYLKLAAQTGELPCLVLLDLNLPLVSGFTVLEVLRSAPELAGTPVCVLSSSDQPRDMERATKMGADGYQVKPSSPSLLCGLVRSLQSRWGLECQPGLGSWRGTEQGEE